MENPQELIGKKVRGFKFESKEDGVVYIDEMNCFIGKKGVILGFYINANTFSVTFEQQIFCYPADQIEAHLVDEEIPTFTKEDLRVAYKAGFNLVKPNKECDGHFERWYQKTYEPTKEEQLTAILGSSEKVSEIMELFKK